MSRSVRVKEEYYICYNLGLSIKAKAYLYLKEYISTW